MRDLKLKGIGPKLSAEDVKDFEQAYNLSLPEDYKRFLLESNGGWPDVAIFDVPGDEELSGMVVSSFLSIAGNLRARDRKIDTNSICWAINLFKECIPKEHLPIAVVGNYDLLTIHLNLDSNPVYLVLTYEFGTRPASEGPPFEAFAVANGFTDFVKILYGSKDPSLQ